MKQKKRKMDTGRSTDFYCYIFAELKCGLYSQVFLVYFAFISGQCLTCLRLIFFAFACLSYIFGRSRKILTNNDMSSLSLSIITYVSVSECVCVCVCPTKYSSAPVSMLIDRHKSVSFYVSHSVYFIFCSDACMKRLLLLIGDSGVHGGLSGSDQLFIYAVTLLFLFLLLIFP